MLLFRPFVLLSSFAATLLLTPAARASSPVSLRWSAPQECPTGAEVLDEVQRLLGPRPDSSEPPLQVIAEVKQKHDGRFVVRLEIPSSDGPRFREVSAVSCQALGQVTALILAMMIDPDAALSAPPSPPPSSSVPVTPMTPSPEAPGQTRAAPVDSAPNPPPLRPPKPLLPVVVIPVVSPPKTTVVQPPKPSIASGPRFSIAAFFVGDAGSLPALTYGVGGDVGRLLGKWRIEFGGAYFAEQKGSLSAVPNGGSQVRFWALHFGAGLAIPLHQRLEIIPRFRLELGRFSASSFGISEPGNGAAIFMGMGIGGAASFQLRQSLRLVLGLDTVLLLARPQFLVTGITPAAHEPSIFVGRIAVGAEVRF